MTSPPDPIATLGADPIWVLWHQWAAERGVVIQAHPAAGHGPLLVSPWDDPPVEAVRRGVEAVGNRRDVWLVMTGACTDLAAEVLAVGGRGCLPRVPGDAALRKVLAVAGWWPRAHRSQVPAAAPSIEPASAEVPSAAPVASMLERFWPARPPRRQPALFQRPVADAPPSPSAGPETQAPVPAGVPLVVLGPWPLREGVPEAVVRDWRHLAQAAREATPVEVTCLGCVPPPMGGHPHPAISVAMAAQRVAVVASLDWAVLVAARALIQALGMRDRLDIEVWLTGERPSPALLKQVSLALRVPCTWVPADPDGEHPACR